MTQQDSILIVDDDPLVLESVKLLFEDDYRVITAQSGSLALEALTTHEEIAAVVLDIRMAEMNGLETATRIGKTCPELPVIFYTGYPGDYSEDSIEEKHHPFGYVTKNQRPVTLKRQVRNAVDLSRLRKQTRRLVDLADSEYRMVGKSGAMIEIFRSIEKIAPTDSKVMIYGETGTGKELVARAIHRRSLRSDREFAVLRCSHKNGQLIESELFGHVKGAFTGADSDRVGLFEFADGGTLFLDEIADLDERTQIKILAALDSGAIQRVGAPERVTQVDVRLICATNRNLGSLVQEGAFREDLYYRLKGANIDLPALRDRREDIDPLIDYFLQMYSNRSGSGIWIMEPEARRLFFDHSWPGNVRELETAVHTLIDMSISGVISAEQTANYLCVESGGAGPDQGLADALLRYERAIILATLARTGGNISKAADLLKIDRANLSKKIKAHSIDPRSFGE